MEGKLLTPANSADGDDNEVIVVFCCEDDASLFVTEFPPDIGNTFTQTHVAVEAVAVFGADVDPVVMKSGG